MDAVSMNTQALDVVQAALARSSAQSAQQIAVLEKAQEVQQQQGAVAVQLIEAAAQPIVDVRV